MNRIGFRTQLFLISMTLILLVTLASGFYLEQALRKWVVERTSSELEHHVEMAKLVFSRHQKQPNIQNLDRLADEIGAATQTHVMVFHPNGQLLGDSHKDLQQIRTQPKHDLTHLTRPNKKKKLTGKDVLTRAMEIQTRQGKLVVVMTFPLSELDLNIKRLRTLIGLASLLGVVVAIFMSGLAAHLMTRTLREIAERAHELTRGAQSQQMYIKGQDELGGLAISITHLAGAMAESVEALAHERDRFEAVLEGMNEAVIVLDDQRRVTLTNTAAHGLVDHNNQQRLHDGELVRITELLPMPALLAVFEEVDAGRVAVAELTLSGPPERVVMARVSPRQNQGALMVLHDVTALRKLERVRRDFVTNVSHELRTPVSVIMANTETLLQGALEDPKHAKRFVTALHRNAERLSRLISDLLDISKIEAGKLTLELEPISVFGAVLRVMDVLEDKIEAKAQEVDIDIDLELLVYADAKSLDQILYNLIDNASKYTPERGILRVHAYMEDAPLRRDADNVVIEVQDDGPGLTPEQRTRIFERFYRVDSGRARENGGTGLGLAIVKHLSHAMKGRAGVKPNQPKGSIFWVRLPLGRPEDSMEIERPMSVEFISDATLDEQT